MKITIYLGLNSIQMESDTASTTLTLPDNFHIYYDEFQAGSNSKETNLVDVIEASIGKVISCMKFDSLPNFIAITLGKERMHFYVVYVSIEFNAFTLIFLYA